MTDYSSITKELMMAAEAFKMPNATRGGVSYSLKEIVYTFRAAFQDEMVRNIILGDFFQSGSYSCGFCGIASYALHKLFPAISIDAAGGNTHVWNVFRGKIFDLTHDQFSTADQKQYYYMQGKRNVENMKLDPYLDRQSDLFLNLVLGHTKK